VLGKGEHTGRDYSARAAFFQFLFPKKIFQEKKKERSRAAAQIFSGTKKKIV